AEVREQRRAATAAALDVAPDGAVLLPANPLSLPGEAVAACERAPVPLSEDRSARAVRRRGRRRHDARAREEADDRASGIGGIGPASACDRTELRQLEVVAAVESGPQKALADARQRPIGQSRALDEVNVQRLVAPLGEQHGASGRTVAAGAAGLLVVGL